MKNILIKGEYFKDAQGRNLMLRGINLGGNVKSPFSVNGASPVQEGLYDNRAITFVGRPFPLAEADEHFNRLRKWGFNFLRLLVSWEAIEHQGPGQYDEAYLDYLYQLVKKAGGYGFNLFIDPHQDVWSRFTGGDGAPRWTLEKVGFDVTHFSDTGAALIQNLPGNSPQKPLPDMIWPTNYNKLACATMFTLFFAGNDFAPKTLVEGEPVQDYLQRHYFQAMQKVAERLKDLPHVIGFDSMNEPSVGWVGWENLHSNWNLLRLGAMPTPLQSMALGSGITQEVEIWQQGLLGARKTRTTVMNFEQRPVWKKGYACVWKENGVWDLDKTGKLQLLRPNHFTEINGRKVDFGRDYFVPFIQKYTQALRAVDSNLTIFIEPPVGTELPSFEATDADNLVHAAHWYDVVTLFTKRYLPFAGADVDAKKVVFGHGKVRRLFIKQLANLKEESRKHLHNAPTLIGEFGIPFDMRAKKAYRTGDFSKQIRALNANYQALEANFLHSTLWNYNSDNTNDHGDYWNGEDLSIFSRNQQTDPHDIHSGGRALRAVVRPYATRIAGTPIKLYFDMELRIFEFEFRHDPAITAPTEFYIPDFRYVPDYIVERSDGTIERNLDKQLLTWHHDPAVELHWIKIYC
ncbi:MAG: cellulase family glycosylhydrolase [Bacteroidota bacterium]